MEGVCYLQKASYTCSPPPASGRRGCRSQLRSPPRQHISRHILPSFTLSPPIHASGRPLHICPPPLPSTSLPLPSNALTSLHTRRERASRNTRLQRQGALRESRRGSSEEHGVRVGVSCGEGERRGSIVVVVFRSLKFALPRELPTPASQEQPWRFGFSSGVSW